MDTLTKDSTGTSGLTKRKLSLYSEPTSLSAGFALDIDNLERRIDELIALCDELEKKQSTMDVDRETWLQERTRLLEKNELAKAKIEAMIMRLKSLEQD